MENTKKVIFLLFIFTTTVVNAQTADNSKKLFQKVTGGVVFGTVASTSFTGTEKPFRLGYNLIPNITIVTPKTYHNILYGFGDNSLRSLNGYFLNNNWDTYLLYSKTLHTGGNYLGLGIEKMIKIENKGEGIKFFLLTEIGTDFKGNHSLSFGLLMSVQNKIWKRK